MYVGCKKLEPIFHFLNGFMVSNYLSHRTNWVEERFKNEFHDWVKNTLEKEYNMELEEHHNYVFYIGQVACEPEEETKIFFELCHNFFDEVKRNIK